MRSVAGGSGPDAEKYAALQDRHDLNCDAVSLLGLRNTFAASVPQHTHVARPSSEEEKLRALVATGKVSASSLWQTVGAVAITSTVVFAAQAQLLEVKELKAREVEEAEAAAQAATIAAAVGVRDRRGDLPDSDMGLQDLKVAVKFAHVERKLTGASKISTKAACLEYLANLNPPWDFSLPPPAEAGPDSGSTPAPGPVPAPLRRKRKPKEERPHSPQAHTPDAPIGIGAIRAAAQVNISSLTKAERCSLMAQLAAAAAADISDEDPAS